MQKALPSRSCCLFLFLWLVEPCAVLQKVSVPFTSHETQSLIGPTAPGHILYIQAKLIDSSTYQSYKLSCVRTHKISGTNFGQARQTSKVPTACLLGTPFSDRIVKKPFFCYLNVSHGTSFLNAYHFSFTRAKQIRFSCFLWLGGRRRWRLRLLRNIPSLPGQEQLHIEADEND